MAEINLRELMDAIGALGSPEAIRAGALGVLGLQKKRIYLDGKNSAGGNIGSYSSKPMYMNPKDSPVKFAPQGKNGDKKFKNGEPHVTRYFPGGYKEVRGKAGRRNDKVNLDFTSQLRFSHTVMMKGKDAVIGFDSGREGGKAAGLEKKYGNIFDLTEDEMDALSTFIINKAFFDKNP